MLIVHSSQQQREKQELTVEVNNILRKSLNESLQDLLELEPSFHSFAGQILQHEVQMLFDSVVLERIVKEELNEDG